MKKQKELLKKIEDFKMELISLKPGDEYLERGLQDLEYLQFGVRNNNPAIAGAVHRLTYDDEICELALEIADKL